jgi:hypothetical protein
VHAEAILSDDLTFEIREENVLLFFEMGRHIGGKLVKNGGNPDHLGMASAMDVCNLMRVGNDLADILLEIDMAGIAVYFKPDVLSRSVAV